MLILHVGMEDGPKNEGRNVMKALEQVIWLALSIFQALGEFSAKINLTLQLSYNADCPLIKKKKKITT